MVLWGGFGLPDWLDQIRTLNALILSRYLLKRFIYALAHRVIGEQSFRLFSNESCKRF